MKKNVVTIKIMAALLLLLSCAGASFAETRIASWNIKRLSEQNKNIESVVDIISYFDLVAIQEVMSEAALENIVSRLQEKTGNNWGIMVSHAIGRGSYKERYAFIWRKSHINFVDSAIVYLDGSDVFAREPMSARFRSIPDNFDFILANIHVLYGDSKSDRIPEIKALASYWAWLGETYPEEQFFVAGDFNMPPDHSSFDLLSKFARPAITSGATTLSKSDGKFSNLYDNIWIPNTLQLDMKSGILNFPKILGTSNKYARKNISDHAPVYIIVESLNEKSGHFSSAYSGGERLGSSYSSP